MTKFQDNSRKNSLLKAVPTTDAPRQTSAQDVADKAVGPYVQNPASQIPATQSGTKAAQDVRAGLQRPQVFENPILPENPALTSADADGMAGSGADRSGVAPIGPVPLPAAPRIGGLAAPGLQRAPARPSTPPTSFASASPAPAGKAQAASGLPGAHNTASSVPRPIPPAGQNPAAAPAGKPIAVAAQLRPRHHGILASFVALVLLPVAVVATYLWVFAVDQYASTVGFSVRTEEMSSSLGLLGGITKLSGGGSSDSDILYDYIHSQELVAELDAQIDLRAIYARAWPEDWVFAFDPDSPIEDLVDHWERMVKITYDNGSGLMTLRVLAFDPDQATLIATKIVEQSTQKINALSDDARDDATRYARLEMERALERLKSAREAMTEFRMRTQMVDPVADLQGQMGILNNLQANLAESYIELDLLRVTTTATDPRIVQVEQRITVIQNRIEEERRKFSESGQGPRGEDYATMVAEFERLSVDREFAEQSYRVALAAYDSALAEAQRKSRYLATHIRPTTAEESKFPQRWTLLGLTAFFLLMAWAIGLLIIYSIRDRR